MLSVFRFHKKLILAGALLVSFFVFASYASADIMGDVRTFSVNSKYDEFSRTALSATLRHLSNRAYFYVDDRYWAGLNQFEKNILLNNLDNLGREFDDNIYSKETGFFGFEPNPGIDDDARVVVLVEDLIKGNGGYFETANLYSKELAPGSNEREMVSVNSESLGSLGKIFLAHEFQHLIAFNQKDLLRNISEDVWLNELRSEYANTVVGYNDSFQNSNLSRRLDTFLTEPSDSLVEWPNVILDYSQVALFAEYLVEQFGPQIISETIRNDLVGIDSINQFLQSNGRPERFSNIFGNWLTANYLNDPSSDSRYGYRRNELKNLRIAPLQYSLAYPGKYELNHDLKPWQGSWHKLNLYSMPEGKALKISFNSQDGFKLRYIDNLGNAGELKNGGYMINKGNLNSIVLMPVNESKTSGFGSSESPITFRASIEYTDVPVKATLKDGDLIKRPHEQEIYVIEGQYKRYLRSEVIALYGHLNPANAIELDNDTFNSFATANYVRSVEEQKVYAVWPDGTKHWLNITPRQWDASGRDWNAIFIINDLELNYYKVGADITR